VLSVTFKNVGPGRCAWCQKDKKEVFFVQCNGFFAGSICWPDLKNAIRYKIGPSAQPAREEGDQCVNKELLQLPPETARWAKDLLVKDGEVEKP
jgi:hypothetical protein